MVDSASFSIPVAVSFYLLSSTLTSIDIHICSVSMVFVRSFRFIDFPFDLILIFVIVIEVKQRLYFDLDFVLCYAVDILYYVINMFVFVN